MLYHELEKGRSYLWVDNHQLLILQYLEGHEFLIIGMLIGERQYRYYKQYDNMILDMPLIEIHTMQPIEDVHYSIELLRTL